MAIELILPGGVEATRTIKPPLLARLGLVLAGWLFVSLEPNPLVVLEARLGLSPAPLERFFHIRGPFSGLTEASVRLAHGEPWRATAVHLLVIPWWIAVVAMVVWWRFPRIRNRRQEYLFLAGVVAVTIINNLAFTGP